jgi:hypothetical protein
VTRDGTGHSSKLFDQLIILDGEGHADVAIATPGGGHRGKEEEQVEWPYRRRRGRIRTEVTERKPKGVKGTGKGRDMRNINIRR